MIQPITGSFIEFEHPNRAERLYTHEALCAFTAERWRHKIRELSSLGMDTLVLLSTALRGYAYFPSFDGFPFAPHLACEDPLEAVLCEADTRNMQVYIGVGFYGTTDSVGNSTDPAVVQTACRAMHALFARYGHHRAFIGWYIADEWCIWDHFDERFITYINTICREAAQLCRSHKVVLAPFGTHCLKADDTLVSQLSRIEADAIAYQDEVGVGKLTLDRLPARFEALRRAHDKAQRAALWVDTEIFTFEDAPYTSALLPAPMERLAAQLEAVSPFVEKIIAYTCQGMMTKPDSAAHLGDPFHRAEQLYTDYTRWLETLKPTP